MVATFSFSYLPWTIQNRFIEICDASTLIQFSQINSCAKNLVKKRIQNERNFKISSINDFKNDASNILKISDSLNISLPHPFALSMIQLEYRNIILPNFHISFDLISRIIPLYSYLVIITRTIEIKALKYLIGPNLIQLWMDGNILYENPTELDEFFDLLLERKVKTVTIFFNNFDSSKINPIKEAFQRFADKFQGSGYLYCPGFNKNFMSIE